MVDIKPPPHRDHRHRARKLYNRENTSQKETEKQDIYIKKKLGKSHMLRKRKSPEKAVRQRSWDPVKMLARSWSRIEVAIWITCG